MPTKKEHTGGFGVTIIFILSIVVLILIFVLFTRDQNSKAVESTLTNLAQTNAELQKEQQVEKTKSIADRLKDAGIDMSSLWILGTCEEPYCQFTGLNTNGEVDATRVRSIERWKGHHETYDDGKVACEMFVLDDQTSLPISTTLLASVEQKLLRDSTRKEKIDITVFRSQDQARDEKSPEHVCDDPAIVLDVHFE